MKVKTPGHHHSYRGDQVPFVSFTPRGSTTPACHCTFSGAVGWRSRAPALSVPRMLTSGAAGASVNLSQQSPREWLCASGSKHVSSEHKEKALQGMDPKSGWFGSGRCWRHASPHSSTDATCAAERRSRGQHQVRAVGQKAAAAPGSGRGRRGWERAGRTVWPMPHRTARPS